MLSQFNQFLKANPIRIFLIDAFGALLTASLLGLVLPFFTALIGIPQSTLYKLAGIACLFVIYSFTVFFVAKTKWRSLLKIIAILNLLYCVVTLYLTFTSGEITIYGKTYFIIEIIIVAALSIFELKVSNKES